jgi:hypothetical protein
MKKNNITKLIFICILGLLLAAGCSGKNGSTGKTGTTGNQGLQGSEGPADPTVSWVMPVQGATGVYTDSVMKVGFSKPMDSSTINASTFSVSTGGIPVTGSVSYNSGSQTAFFDPNVPLYQFGFYTATLTTGIKDTMGNPLAASYTWMFLAGGSSTPSILYVGNPGTPSILVFNNAGSVNGNVFPDRTITSGSLSWPWRMWLDKATDRLYIATDNSSILVFNSASTINGAVTPSRTITGTLFTATSGIWLDSANDRLYMADSSSSAIYVFNNISTLNGTVTPDRIVFGANTTINGPRFLWLDTLTDRLYVANYSNDSILVFNSASTINGDVVPSRAITGSTITNPAGIWIDASSDRMYVADSGGSALLVFNNASTINGAVTPDRIVYGSNTTFASPYALWLDTANDRIYVSDYSNGSVDVFNSASTINGNIAPSRSIAGANTGFTNPEPIWLDMNP